MMKRLRVYADTSVFGGCHDDEFLDVSRSFFDEVSAGRFRLVISEVVLRELALAPESVQAVLGRLDPQSVEILRFTEEVGRLRDGYIRAGVLGSASVNDAEHIAFGSVAVVDLFVSWNFKHIVHFDKIAGFGAVNLLHGYREIRIHSPREVIEHDTGEGI
ncbi:MAG: hypothetical protein ACKV22_03225 [Bryobacteraceae bacterium]